LSLTIFIGALLALVLTSLLILWLRPVARTVGLVDVPNERKAHKGEIPLIGGLSIFIAAFAAKTVSGFISPDGMEAIDYNSFYLAGMLMVLAGSIDDYRDLSPTTKLVARVFAVPFTIFACIGVINAVNMSDGLDGLAGSLALVPLLGFIAATSLFGSGEDLGILVILASAVGGFLIFNFRVPGRNTAMVFLGDSGSMFLGLTLCWFAIKFSQGENRIIAPAAALWFLLLPLFDAVSMTTRRILKKRPPFGADKEHLHHIFLLAGFTVPETVGIMSGIGVLGVGVGLTGTYFAIPDPIMLGSFVILGGLYLWMIVRSWSVMRFLRYSICRRHNSMDRRVIKDRRCNSDVAYLGPERRSGIDRRHDPRRSEDSQNVVNLKRAG